jgi:hypothetical protein
MITNKDDMLVSSDIIDRIKELELHLETEPDDWTINDAEELLNLITVQEQCEDVADWEHGEALIRESYFTDYIEELINDCYDMPKEINSGDWPWRHMKIDYEAAAQEAKADYEEIDFDGTTYLIRA